MKKLMPNENKIPVTVMMLCYVLYVSFILINDYIAYFRLFSAPVLGYALAALITGLAAFFLRRYVEIEKTPFHLADILVVAACLALYALKAAMPNHWYDADNYHIYFQEYPFADIASRNFFPATAGQNYTSVLADRAAAPFRRILGYRLRTLPNPLFFILFYYQAKRILLALTASLSPSRGLIAACSAIGFVSLQAYFILNCYNSDLWYVPLILEIVYLLVAGASNPAITVYLCWLGGLASSMKMNNAMFIVLLALVYIAFSYKTLRVKSVLIGVLAFIFPIAIYALNVYLQTGNPVFPFFNNIFQSEYAPLSFELDPRWGPVNVLEGLVWPIYGMFDTSRTSGMDYIDISLGAGYILALVWLSIAGYRRFVRKERAGFCWLLPGLIVGMHLINAFLMIGYWRYIIFLCPLSGALAGKTFIELYAALKKKRPKKERLPARKKAPLYAGMAAALLPFVVNLALMVNLALYTTHNQGYMAPLTAQPLTHGRNAAYLLKDQASGVDESFIKDIKALAMSSETSAIPALLSMGDTPLINVNPGTAPERQQALLTPYRDGGFYLISIGEYAEYQLSYLNGTNFRLKGDIRRTRANFIKSDDWLYAFELEPLPFGESSVIEVLSANILSETPSFEWKIPEGAAGRRTFEAFFGTGTNLPNWSRDFAETITNVYLRQGDAQELLATYTLAPDAMLSKISLELFVPEGDCSLVFDVSPQGAPGAPWTVMLVQPELYSVPAKFTTSLRSFRTLAASPST